MAALNKMKHFVFGRVYSADYEDESVPNSVGWKPLNPPLHLGWPGHASSYEKVPSIDVSLAKLESFKKQGSPNTGSPEGTSLPFLAPEALEPAPPPPGIDPVQQQRLSISFRRLRHKLLQEPGLFELNVLQLYKWHMLRCSLLFASFAGFYAYATTRCEFVPLPLFKETELTSAFQTTSLLPPFPSDSGCTRSCSWLVS